MLTGTPTAISLFSGCGGLDLGVAQAGFRLAASVELDEHAANTLRTWTDRLPYHHSTIVGDIRALTSVDIMRAAELDSGSVDLLVGGPPCQSFSGIGFRRGLDDPRGLLLFEVVRFARELRPRAIMVEQVKGLVNFVDSSGFRVLDLLANELGSLGYTVTWKVLNAADYGVPQSRERVFIVAVEGDRPFAFPEPTHSRETGPSLFGVRDRYRVVGDALRGLSTPPTKGEIGTDPNHMDVTPARDRERIRDVPEGQWLSAQLQLPQELRGNLGIKDTTKYRRLHRESTALTLRCGEIHYHPIEDRYLTPREYLRLHGYPDWFQLTGPIRSRTGRVRDLDQHRQVANSVPPPLAFAIAFSIRDHLRTLPEWQRSAKSLVMR